MVSLCKRQNAGHGSHDIIHTFKNDFATVFSVFSFSKNKLYPNEPLNIPILHFSCLQKKKKKKKFAVFVIKIILLSKQNLGTKSISFGLH